MLTPPPLEPEEQSIILHKGTESPYSGKYTSFEGRGVYLCRQCGAPLYRSLDKFSSHCGWPSFDDEIEGQVGTFPDADGKRVEIICQKCQGHLGHVFKGEGFTEKNCRHCVNSLSLIFFSFENLQKLVLEKPNQFDSICVGGGCFWGVEKKLSEVPGILATRVGYTGGSLSNPTYEAVCGQQTGHAEAVQVILWLEKLSLEDFYKVFFSIHDPSQLNRQGPDTGDQYRSVIFYRNEGQKQVAQKILSLLEDKGQNIVTTLESLKDFWEAEAYHQCYFKKR